MADVPLKEIVVPFDGSELSEMAVPYAEEIAPAEHFDVRDVALTFTSEEKKVGSSEGHSTATSSPFHEARVTEAQRLAGPLTRAILDRDFPAIGAIAERDALLMHGVMMTSDPSLVYWLPQTVAAIRACRRWREEQGLNAYFTIDAGPNVHVLCLGEDAREIAGLARDELAPESLIATPPGSGARLVRDHLF